MYLCISSKWKYDANNQLLLYKNMLQRNLRSNCIENKNYCESSCKSIFYGVLSY